MAAELGLMQLQKLAQLQQQQQEQHQQQLAMWNYASRRSTNSNEEEDSWEVRAFAEDTGNALGTTWPPRSYTCSYCRREFRSAQALGGHMNVHRRDRARLRQSPQLPCDPSAVSVAASASSPPMFLFYPVPSHAVDSPSTFLSISPCAPVVNFGAPLLGKVGMVRDDSDGKERRSSEDGGIVEELDLELRLGWGF